MNKLLFAGFICLLKFGVGYGQHQTFYHDLRDGGNSSIPRRLVALQDGYIISVNRLGQVELRRYSSDGQLLATFVKPNYSIQNFTKVAENNYILRSAKFSSIVHADSVIYSILDSMLHPIREFQHTKANWPRPYFANRSFNGTYLNDNAAYFGRFLDSSNAASDDNPLHGWLVLNPTKDSIKTAALNTDFSATRMLYCYPADTGFYSIDPVTGVNLPWAQPVSVTSISKFNHQMQWQKSANFSMPSNLPGYPRIFGSYGSIDLAINNHSVYAMAKFEAASPNFLSITQKSCAIYRFDRELNRLKVVHDTVATGKEIETSGTNQIVLDRSGKFIYALWKECAPNQFNDQTRECATIVLKYDTALNLVWKRVFSVPDMNFHGETMAPTSDGGLLVAGFYIDLPPGPNLRQTFVLKVDSAGNHVVSVPGVSALDNKVTAYPNPTHDVLNLSWQSGSFHQLLLRDVQGRLVSEVPLDPQATSTQLDVQSWAPGLYFYQLRSPSGQQLQGKFLKR